ncbi:class I SAM-dependent methyltransferase [Paracoccus sediminilitoris]|uniref:class I SAM-dependent methyltransferase n=1 Tax=Paracoccus sediminilitoris TaxID=2202419 RepID=UPI00272C8613|nr:class I SAM-dependent methyltransferase [Paracoccus sediminilitoris]
MGFSPEWLSLREPVDRQARDDALMQRAVRAAGSRPVIMDLGCGTGSTLRAMSGHIPAGAQWHLVDNDPALLAIARDQARDARTHVLDLGRLSALPLDGVTLVTASALLDLMPAAWVRDLARLLADRGIGFYAALSYDGVMTWDPTLPGDGEARAAFNRHQRGDKGLGPALGPDAGSFARSAFAEAGFDTAIADSPWKIGAEHARMHEQLVQGIAEAAGEQGLERPDDWARDRIAQGGLCTIGHQDLLALPSQDRKD